MSESGEARSREAQSREAQFRDAQFREAQFREAQSREAQSREAQFRELYAELRITDQRRFYEARTAEYTSAHDQAILVRNVLLGLAAAVGLVGQLGTGHARALSGVVAAVLGALAAAVAAFESMTGFVPLSKLYDDADLNLRAAEIAWKAAPPGSDVAARLAQVEDVLRSENGQWGQLTVQSAEDHPPPGDR